MSGGNKLTGSTVGQGESLLSGLHRYAGDPDHLKLRIIFTDHALLATRPRFRVNDQTNQNHHNDNNKDKTSQEGNKQSSPGAAETVTPPTTTRPTDSDGLHSTSYLIKRRRNTKNSHGRSACGWTIRPEADNCPLQRNGLKLRVTSCSGSVCSSCVNIAACYKRKSSNCFDGGGASASWKDSRASGITVADWKDSGSSRQQSNGTNRLDGCATRSGPAFDWKDTNAIVSPDKDGGWKRTVARKLPGEMRNHIQQYHHHAATATPSDGLPTLAAAATGLPEGCFCLCNGSSSRLGAATGGGSYEGGCQLLTDWYQSKLLNRDEQKEEEDRQDLQAMRIQKQISKALDAARDGNLAHSQASTSGAGDDGCKNGARMSEFDSSDDDDNSNSNIREPDDYTSQLVEPTDAKLDSGDASSKSKDNTAAIHLNVQSVSHATNNHTSPLVLIEEEKNEMIKKQKPMALAADNNNELVGLAASASLSLLGPRCSHVEILYIIMINNRMFGDDTVVDSKGASFALSMPTTTTTSVPATAAAATTNTDKATDATVSSATAAASGPVNSVADGRQSESSEIDDRCTDSAEIGARQSQDKDKERGEEGELHPTTTTNTNSANDDDDDDLPKQPTRSNERNGSGHQDHGKGNEHEDKDDKVGWQQGVIERASRRGNHKLNRNKGGGGGTNANTRIVGAGSTAIKVSGMAADSYGQDGDDEDDHHPQSSSVSSESSDKDDENGEIEEENQRQQINHPSSGDGNRRQAINWMLNGRQDNTTTRRVTIGGSNSNEVEFCLAVIVIDKLNRLIQLKPDLNKLISVDVGQELGLGGGLISGDGASNPDATTAAGSAGATSGGFPRSSSQRATQIQSSILLYQLKLAGDDGGGGGGSGGRRKQLRRREGSSVVGASEKVLDGASEPERQLNLLYRRLLLKPQFEYNNHQMDKSNIEATSESGHHLAGFAFSKPALNDGGDGGGGMLIKLQFDIQFASDFPNDCRNLYVKYKLLAKLRGSRWRLKRCRGHRAQQPLAAATRRGRMGMKEEIGKQLDKEFRQGATSVPPPLDGKLVKLAQMSHLIISATDGGNGGAASSATAATPNQPQHPQIINMVPPQFPATTNAANDDYDEPKKPSAKSTLAQPVDGGDGHPSRKLEPPPAPPLPPPPGGSEGGPDTDTCFLEGSTITSQPDSSGRFHFACVEELVLELVACSDNKWLKQDTTSAHRFHRHPLLSSRSLSEMSKQPADSLQHNQQTQKSFESKQPPVDIKLASTDDHDSLSHHQLGGNARKVSLPEPKASHGGTNQTQNPSPKTDNTSSAGLSRLSEAIDGDGDKDENQVIISEEIDRLNGCGNNYENAKTSPPGNKILSPTTDNQQQQLGEVPATPRANDNEIDNCKNDSRAGNEAACGGSDFHHADVDGDGDDDDDGDLEIVLLFEFYSSDFYRDKLQGWSHLSIPVNLDTTRAKQTIENNNNLPWTQMMTIDDNWPAVPWNARGQRDKGFLGGCCCVTGPDQRRVGPKSFILPVIIPELCSMVDKLRYYLIGQLPSSMPPIESFAKSKHRHMLLTRQSGKLALNCEIVRQLGYNPDTFDSLRTSAEINLWQRPGKIGGASNLDRILINKQETTGGDSVGAASNNRNAGGLEADRNGIDTRGVVEAYRRTRDRIDKLNLDSLLKGKLTF